MKKLLFTALTTLLASTAIAQEENPNTYGRWDFTADNGMQGSVIIDAGFCHYTVSSAFSSAQSRCFAHWRPDTNTLIIAPPANVRAQSFSVPEYRDQRGPEIVASQGDMGFTFHMTRFGVKWMSGHLVGAGDHVSVRLEQH